MFAQFLLLTLLWYSNTAEENKRFLSAYLRFEGAFYLPAKEPQILQIIKVLPSNLTLSCLLRCVAETSCLSINVAAAPNSNDGRVVCELLTTNIINGKDRLQPSGNFFHYTKYNPCYNEPCLNGGTCELKMGYQAVCHCKFGFLGDYCSRDCAKPLGMESRAIPNNMITARSVYGSGHLPWSGRLNNMPSLPYTYADTGSYSAKTNQQGEWLQIDLGVKKLLTKVATQGRPYLHYQWITKYTISYSDNGTTWFPYKENKIVKVFQGNVDRDTIKTNIFINVIQARYIRIQPTAWNSHISLRAELYGCSLK